jgi:hypothetical protein
MRKGTCSDSVQYVVHLFSSVYNVSFVSYIFAIFGTPVQSEACPTCRGYKASLRRSVKRTNVLAPYCYYVVVLPTASMHALPIKSVTSEIGPFA